MRAKGLPAHRITPTRDPLLDGGRWDALIDGLKRWGIGLILALALAVADSVIAGRAKAETISHQVEQLGAKYREIARLEHQLELRRAAGSCQTLFYLIEADDADHAGQKLRQAAMKAAGAANELLYPPARRTTPSP